MSHTENTNLSILKIVSSKNNYYQQVPSLKSHMKAVPSRRLVIGGRQLLTCRMQTAGQKEAQIHSSGRCNLPTHIQSCTVNQVITFANTIDLFPKSSKSRLAHPSATGKVSKSHKNLEEISARKIFNQNSGVFSAQGIKCELDQLILQWAALSAPNLTAEES